MMGPYCSVVYSALLQSAVKNSAVLCLQYRTVQYCCRSDAIEAKCPFRHDPVNSELGPNMGIIYAPSQIRVRFSGLLCTLSPMLALTTIVQKWGVQRLLGAIKNASNLLTISVFEIIGKSHYQGQKRTQRLRCAIL